MAQMSPASQGDGQLLKHPLNLNDTGILPVSVLTGARIRARFYLANISGF